MVNESKFGDAIIRYSIGVKIHVLSLEAKFGGLWNSKVSLLLASPSGIKSIFELILKKTANVMF